MAASISLPHFTWPISGGFFALAGSVAIASAAATKHAFPIMRDMDESGFSFLTEVW